MAVRREPMSGLGRSVIGHAYPFGMVRMRTHVAVLLLAALSFAACAGGSKGAAYDPASRNTSELDSAIQAPPVPKSLSTSTTLAPTGATYYVASRGNDSNTGTKDEPFKTISHGVGRLKAGDTLMIGPGEYVEDDGDAGLRIKNLNGTAAKPITIAGGSAEKPRLTGGLWKTVAVEKSSFIVLRGLETIGTAMTDKKPTSGIEIIDSHHVTVADSYVHDGGGGGIGSIRSNHISVIGNYVAGMAKWNPFQTSGISLFDSTNIGGDADADGYSMRIVDNVVFGTENIALPNGGNTVTDGNCIIVDTGDTNRYAGRTYIANNVCANNGGRGIHVFKSQNVVAVNNTMYHNMQTAKLKEEGGELSAVSARGVIFRNNLVVARSNRKASFTYQSEGITFDANLYEGEGKAPTGTELMAPNVGLAAPDDGNFALLAGSPAIDVGDSDGAPATDQEGKPRRGQPDVGAFEAAS